MVSEVTGPDFSYRFTLIDIRDLDGEKLIESANLGDNVTAILARLRNRRQAIREIVRRIVEQPVSARQAAVNQLLILAGSRRLEDVVEKETREMPITIDPMENRVLAREYRRGLAEGEFGILQRLLVKRFGPLPEWAETSLRRRDAAALEQLAERLLDAASLNELLK